MPLLLAFAVSSIIGCIAFWRGSLSATGAIIIGAVTFGFGGWMWGLLLVLFFVTSSVLSRFREADKHKAAEASEKGSRRDLGQVLANGGVPAGLALSERHRGSAGRSSLSFWEVEWREEFHGIWLCALLLHVPSPEFPEGQRGLQRLCGIAALDTCRSN